MSIKLLLKTNKIGLNNMPTLLFSLLLLFSACIFISCPNPMVEWIMEGSKNNELITGPSLSGTATISGTYRMGETLTVNTENITGGEGDFLFQWRAGGVDIAGANSDTYTIQGADAGRVITCVITRSDIAGSVTAHGQEVAFDLVLNTAGLTSPSTASFRSGNALNTFAVSNGMVYIDYTLASTHNANILRLNINAYYIEGSPLLGPGIPGEGYLVYTVYSDHADNGVITINAVSIHTNDPIIAIISQPALALTIALPSGSGTLSVQANVYPAGLLTYQWFRNTTNSNSGGTSIPGATSASLNIPAGLGGSIMAGTHYFYCVVSAPGAASVSSNVTVVTVTPPGGGPLTSIPEIVAYLATYPPVNTPANPIHLEIALNLGDMTNAASNWQELLQTIANAGLYVELDLTACTMVGTNFNPVSSISTGKNYIVSIDLPTVSTSIAGGTPGSPTIPTFAHFTNLESVSGADITSIGIVAFTGCTSLTTANFPAATTIGFQAFAGCTNLTTADFPLVTGIASNAFLNCTSLTTVDFPLVTIIGNWAFEGCISLATVNFPALTSIGEGAFRNCASLTTVDFPLVTIIGRDAFVNCTSLTSVSFPLVTIIDSATFANCTNLTSASFPLVTSMGWNVFFGCTSLTTVDFPLVTNIGNGAFSGCTALADVTLGTITEANFHTDSGFPGDLRDVYFAPGGGAGRYTRTPPDTTWTKD
ncbi:MAG: leucine-rich repeat domain-containing protein [Spirochaetaceae bacterium]|nr:leucine-rich repeat domain-containing protein [Spirochaetaceae bacterium]